MASTLSMPTGTQIKGTHGHYLISKQLHRNIWRAVEKRTYQAVIVKSAPDFFLRNERDILQRFHVVPSLRHFIDEIQDPPLLVLENLESNLLIESGTRKLESPEVKQVTYAVLQALTALHEEGIVHTGASRMIISLLWGEHWHIFKPPKVDPADSVYAIEVLRRQHQYFGPFPLSYRNLVDNETLDTLTVIMESVEKRTPFKMASSKEITREDRDFVCKLMRLDPRDRPSAKILLQDAWLIGSTADFKGNIDR
ncbi:MAG: hypothetical protein Q9188_003491 [Gyalolechia gomerana]